MGAGPHGEPLTQVLEYWEAEASKRQNPVMGTEDPLSLDPRTCEFKIGVVEWGDPIDYVAINPDVVERFDRSRLGESRQDVVLGHVPATGVAKATAVSISQARQLQKAAKQRQRAANPDKPLENPIGIDLR